MTESDASISSANVIADNIEHLKVLFPDAFSEGKIDFEILKQLLGEAIDDTEEKYCLNWYGKRQARQLALTPSTGTLRPCPEESLDWETTQNLMIEGDNLEVLKLLQKSYANKVKFIYIDPPYNTGKDFVYPDNYRENLNNYLSITGQVSGVNRVSTNTESSGRFHTDWLNMMYPRLKLARNFLQENGIIFVSIDQVELSNLRLIMDEIFGGENLLAILTRKAMHTVRNSSKDFNLHADYVCVYAKNKQWFGQAKERYIRRPSDKKSSYPYDDRDGRGPYKLDPLHARNPYKRYEHIFSNGVVWNPPSGSYPRYSRESLQTMEAEGRISFDNGQPKAKRYLNEVQEGVPPNTMLDPEDVGYNLHGTKELRETLEKDKVFPQPKPIALITYLVSLADEPDAIIMDFFAGSGTTGHAVMNMNVKDNGNRKYILVQLPEPFDPDDTIARTAIEYCDSIGKPHNIAELTKERLRRAAQKIKDTNPQFSGDLGFRVFKLSTSNIRIWDPDAEDLTTTLMNNIDHIKPDRGEKDILYELLLKLGMDLCAPIKARTIVDKNVNSVGDGELIACLDEQITQKEVEPLALGIVDWHAEFEPSGDSTIIFLDSAFEDDIAKTNMCLFLNQRKLANVRSL